MAFLNKRKLSINLVNHCHWGINNRLALASKSSIRHAFDQILEKLWFSKGCGIVYINIAVLNGRLWLVIGGYNSTLLQLAGFVCGKAGW